MPSSGRLWPLTKLALAGALFCALAAGSSEEAAAATGATAAAGAAAPDVHHLLRHIGVGEGKLDETVAFWTVAEVAEWLAETGHGPFIETFTAAGIDGPHLLALRHHHMMEHLGILSVADRKGLISSIEELRAGMLDAPAHLWEWRAARRRWADAIIAGINNCPRVTILYFKYFEPRMLKPAFKGTTGLGFWTAWLLCPRIEIAHYFDEFRHMHPDLVLHSWITAIAATITEGCGWFLLLLAPHCLPEHERGMEGDLVKSTLSRAVMVAGLYLSYPMLPLALQDLCLYGLLLWPYIGIAMGLFYVFATAKLLVLSVVSLFVGSSEKKRD